MTHREAFIKRGLELMHLPYLWDGKGLIGPCAWNNTPGAAEPYDGRDCSGFVTSVLHDIGGPDWRTTYNTGRLFTELAGPDAVMPGDLALYAINGRIHHVMVVLGVGELVFGSAGGDQTTLTPTKGACVQIWQTKDVMHGFAGYRRIPFLDAL